MATRAQLSQERSRIRRGELLAAAIELFAEGGSRSITHRAVAARAGLPSATTTYYFETIDELIREALGNHIDEWTHDLEALAQIEPGANASVDDVGILIKTVFAARGPDVAALELAIYLASARVPELRDHAARAMRAFEALTTSLLARVGVDESRDLAAALVSLFAGAAVRRQSGVNTEIAEARILTSAIRDLIAAHVIGPEGIDRALAAHREAQP